MSEAKLLTPATNYAVVQLPGRRFPGIVFQGDSLHSLIKRLESLATVHREAEQKEGLLEVVEDLREVLDGYERVLSELGMQRPY